MLITYYNDWRHLSAAPVAALSPYRVVIIEAALAEYHIILNTTAVIINADNTLEVTTDLVIDLLHVQDYCYCAYLINADMPISVMDKLLADCWYHDSNNSGDGNVK
jgi:hypothetical protein